nr:hypothetical protein [Tanacetum cinerariifolium]
MSTPSLDTESDLEEAPSEAEESWPLDSTAPLLPDHPLTHVSPTPTPTRALFHRRTARMRVRAQPAIFLGPLASMTEAMALLDFAFCKRYRSSYETPSPSLTLPVQKRYIGTSKLILDTDSEGGELGDEDTEEDESSDADDDRERSDDEDHGLDDEARDLEGEGLGLEEGEDEAVPEGQQQATPVVDTTASEPLGLGYEALRRRELVVGEDQVPSTFEVGQSSSYTSLDTASPKWSSGSLPISPSSLVVPSPIDSPMATLTATILIDKDQFIERYRFRSLEREQDRAIVTFGSLWRPVLALEAWAGHVDTQIKDMSRARSLGESKETLLEETNFIEDQCVEWRNGIFLLLLRLEIELNFRRKIPLRRLDCDNRSCPKYSASAGMPFKYISDISELRFQEHWDMLVVTSGDARSWYMISGDAKLTGDFSTL